MTRKEKRELGLLPRQVFCGMRQMVKDGEVEIPANMTKKETKAKAAELSFIYAASVSESQEYGDSWSQVGNGTYGVDFDGILAFLEKLMELFLKFYPLFIL